jgi:hypothetical protein
MGHLLGREHSDDPHGLMHDTLPAGVRRNPEHDDLLLAVAFEPSLGTRRTALAVDDLFAQFSSE